MPNDAKNINITSIEDLVNSSLDIAAEEVLMESSATKEKIVAAKEEAPESELAEEFNLDEPEDALDIKPELESAPDMQEELLEEPVTPVEEVIESPTESSVTSEEQVNVAELEEIAEPELTDEFDLDEPTDTLGLESEPEADMQGAAELIELSENTDPEDTDLDSIPTEATGQTTPTEELVPVDSIEALESEVSELESEIQLQMDKLVVKSDHLKANNQSELTRVSADNEQLQQQVTTLTQQLSETEEKIQHLAEVQDRQQATIQKLIKILKGVNTKITHLYDEK